MRRSGVLLSVLAILIVHSTLLWIYHSPAPKELMGDEVMYNSVAQRILRGEDPAMELLWPPLYPRFVAWLLFAGRGSLLMVQLVQSLLVVFIAVTARDLCRRMLGPGPVGDWVALATLLYPPLVAFAHYLWPEVLHLALFMAALWILAVRRRRVPGLMGLGLVLGLALLTKSLLGPFLPLLLLPIALDEGRWTARAARVALVLLVLGATIAPTVVANYRRSGEAVISDSSRFNIWVGLNERSRRNFVDEVVAEEYQRYRRSAPDHRRRNELLEQQIGELLREKGLLAVLGGQLGRQYFRLMNKDSFLSDQLPGGPIADRGGGYRETQRAVALAIRLVSHGMYAVILVAAAVGLALCPPRGRRWLWLLLAYLAYNLALFLILHVKTRYRIQFLPVLFFYASYAINWWLARFRCRPSAQPSHEPPRWAWSLAAVGAVLALFLAFGGPLLD